MSGRRSGAEGPRRIDESLPAVVRRFSPHSPDQLAAIFGHWEDIVGPALAAHVRPVRATAETLVVAADHPAWATQVRSLANTVLAKVAETAGQAPTRLEVVVRRPVR